MSKLRIFFLLFVFIFSFEIFADSQTVTITKVEGKVEIKSPEGDWTPVDEGTLVETGAIISTGFNSHASLDIGASTLLVKPLTRMKLEDFMQQNDVQTTSLFLRVGRVKVDVKTTEGLKQDFKVKSPFSTASVRGTSFEFDGENLFVDEGMVALSNSLNHSVSVGPQESSKVYGFQKPKPAKNMKEARSKINPVAAPQKGKQKAEKAQGKEKNRQPGKKEQVDQFGEIVIRWKL